MKNAGQETSANKWLYLDQRDRLFTETAHFFEDIQQVKG
jgi:hypothetical protein